MKKILFTILFLIPFIAQASFWDNLFHINSPLLGAATSTIVQNIVIKDLASGVGNCLKINDSTGLVKTTACGSGGGGGLSSSTPFSAGYIPFTTSTNSLTNSNIFQSGQNIGIGTTNPGSLLELQGGNLVVGGTATSTITGDGTTSTIGRNLEILGDLTTLRINVSPGYMIDIGDGNGLNWNGGDLYLTGNNATYFEFGGVTTTDIFHIYNQNTNGVTIFNTQDVTGNKTFNFPDISGSFVLGTSTIGSLAKWTALNTLQNAVSGVDYQNPISFPIPIASTSLSVVGNLTLNGNVLNTIQDIQTTSSPSFSSSTLTGQMNLGTFIDFTDIGAINTTPIAGHARLHAETTQGFTRLEMDDEGATDVVISRDNVFIVRNTSGVDIATGTPIYITGSTGNVPNVSSSLSNSTTTLPAMGLALERIANNAFGRSMDVGVIGKLNTSMWATGDQLYVSSTASGINLTNVRPSYPNLVQRVGSVLVSNAGTGSIGVMIAPAILGRETGTINPNFDIGGTFALTTTTLTDYLSPGTGIGLSALNGVVTITNIRPHITSTIVTNLTTATGNAFTFATSSDTNVGVKIVCDVATCTWTPTWIGTLADSRITSASTWNGKQNNISFPIPVASTSLTVTSPLLLSVNNLSFGGTFATSGSANIRIASSSGTWTFSQPASTNSVNGYLASTDFTKFDTRDVSFNVLNATTSVLATTTIQREFYQAITITQVSCSTNGASITIGMDERASSTPNTLGTGVFNGGSLTCTSSSVSTSTFANSTIATGAILNTDIDTVANATTTLRVHIKYTLD